MEHTANKDIASDEEVEHTIGMLEEWLDEHDENRIRVQEKLDEACNKLREQLEKMAESVSERLEENFKKEDDKAQETLVELRRLTSHEGERDEEQKAKLAEVMARAKAILLVKPSYELRKPDRYKDDGKTKLTPFRDNVRYREYEEYLKKKFEELQKVITEREEEEKKDPDLSNLYELDIKNDVVTERLCMRKPAGLKLVGTSAGRVYLSFARSFSTEEEEVLSEHNLIGGISYKAAIRRDGSDKWIEYELVIEDKEKKDEYSFVPLLCSDSVFFIKVCCEMRGCEHQSEWSECIEFTPKFSEVCGWRTCTEKKNDGTEAYSIPEENPMTIKSNGFNEKVRVITTVSLPPNKVTSWSFKVSQENNYIDFYVGVHSLIDNREVDGLDGDDDNMRDDNDRDEVSGWYLNCNNSKPYKVSNDFYSTREKPKAMQWVKKCLKKGDIVGVVMDTTKGELSFYLNGVNLGVAFDDIPLDKPLVPCVVLEDEGDVFELDLSEVKENVGKAVSVPSRIAAKDNGWDTITLAWNHVVGASFYQIELDGGKFWNSTADITYTFTKFSPESEHTFRARSVRDGSVSEWSDVVKGKTGALPDFSESVWRYCYDSKGRDVTKRRRNKVKSLVDSKNPKIATSMTYDDTLNVVGSVMLQPNKITSWNINILSLAKPEDAETNENSLLIGVAPVYWKGEDNFEPWECYGWYLDCTKSKLKSGPPHNIHTKEYGPRKEGGESIHAGDTIGVVMDMTKGELSFVLDGVNLGVAYEGIPLDRPLAPCVVLSRFGDSVELDPTEVKLNVVSNTVPVPANVRVERRTWDSIEFAWDIAEGVSVYHVEVDSDGLCLRTTSNSYTLQKLLPGTEHSVKVRSLHKNEMSEWSNAVVGKTEEKYPPFSECVWGDAGKSAVYEVDGSNKKIATKTSNKRFCKVLGNIPVPQNDVVSWTVKLVRTNIDDKWGDGVLIGVSPCDAEADSKEYDSEKGEEYFYCDSFLSAVGAGKKTVKSVPDKYLHAGDTVGVVMDTRKGEISFVVNGVGYNYTKEKIPLGKPLVPCVVLFNEGDSVELDLAEVKENVSADVPVPQGVASGDVAWDSVTLRWDAVDGASFYQVEVDGELQKKILTECTFTKGGFGAESEHSFRVRCVKDRAVSEWSDVVKERTTVLPDFSECVWREFVEDDDDSYDGKYTVDKENPRIVTNTDNKENSSETCGSVPLPCNEISSWGIKVLDIQSESICIGVAVYDGDIYCRQRIRCYNSVQISDRKARKPWKTSRCLVNPGDTVGVVVDTTEGKISFVVNGVNLGVAHEDVPLDKPLIPYVELDKEGDSVELVLSEVKENVDSSIPIPSSIGIESKACDTLTLTWGCVESAIFYQVEVDGIKTLNVPPPSLSSSAQEVTFDVLDLLPDTEHSVRVRCAREGGVSEWSDVVKGRTLVHPDFSECVWKFTDDDSQKEYSLDENNKKLMTKMASVSKWSSSYIVGNMLIPLNAVTTWNVKIIKSLNNDGKGICIGISQHVEKSRYRRWYIDCYDSELGFPIGRNKYSDSDSNEYGPRKNDGTYVRTGDIVGVVVDTTKGELSFVLNGVNYGVAFKRLPLDKPLLPYIEIEKEGDSVELII